MITTKKALIWVSIWVGLAALFNLGVYGYYYFELNPAIANSREIADDKALEFLGGYIIEQSLSLDNLFLFLVIFGAFGIEPKYQRRVLNYGITGAIILRLLFVLLGVAAISAFHWILGVFGIILILSGAKMLLSKEEQEKDFKNSPIIRALSKVIPITDDLVGEKFFVRKNKMLYATPLFAILVLVEFSDIIFAIDSIPAIFSITTDTFIVYTSNMFAIMGLRSLYFLLEKVHRAFRYVKVGVSFILVFTGIKLCLAAPFHFVVFGMEVKTPHMEIPIVWSIGIIFGLILLSVLASVFIKEKNA